MTFIEKFVNKVRTEENSFVLNDGDKFYYFFTRSGRRSSFVIDFYKVDEKSELIVISDDVSLDMGQIRIRKRGSDGGHNGLKNIIMHLGHDEFIRVRMGVGEKPPRMDLADYVLGHFSAQEREVMNESARTAALAGIS